jgi:hypothetical protein
MAMQHILVTSQCPVMSNLLVFHLAHLMILPNLLWVLHLKVSCSTVLCSHAGFVMRSSARLKHLVVTWVPIANKRRRTKISVIGSPFGWINRRLPSWLFGLKDDFNVRMQNNCLIRGITIASYHTIQCFPASFIRNCWDHNVWIVLNFFFYSWMNQNYYIKTSRGNFMIHILLLF